MQIEYGRRLQRIRIARGITSQSALGKRIGVGKSRVGAWEEGRSTPESIELLYRLCTALGVTSDYLLFGDARSLTGEAYKTLVVEAEIS